MNEPLPTAEPTPSEIRQTERIRRLIKRLFPGSPLRRPAEDLLRDGPQPIETVEPMLRALTNLSYWFREESEVSAWILNQAELSLEQRHTCLETLQPFVAKWVKPDKGRKVIRWFWRAMMLSSLPLGLLFYVLYASESPDYPTYFSAWSETLNFLGACTLLACLSSPITAPLSLALDSRRHRRVSAAVYALGSLRLPESVGTLAAAWICKPVRAVAEDALLLALPTLTSEHYGQIGSSTVPNLCLILDHMEGPLYMSDTWERPLISEILRALEKVGDGRAVTSVERITVMEHIYGKDSLLAAEILPTLRARQQQEKESGMLLRAASVPQAAPDQLLRPATGGTTETPSQQLLRASASGDEAQR